MKKIVLFTLVTMIILSCSNNEQQPRIVYDQTDEDQTEEKQDSFLMQVMDLPIQFDSTNVLLHPIGELIEYSGGGRKFSYSSSSGKSYVKTKISQHNRHSLSGSIKNIKFEDIETGTINTLTDKGILIQSANFLYNFSQKTGKQLLVYSVYDKDTNKDKKLDRTDLESLYISRIDGTGFQKLNAENQEIIEWKVLTATEKLYFRTVTDTNRNGKFDKGDSFQNYQVDLNRTANFKAEQYTLLE